MPTDVKPLRSFSRVLVVVPTLNERDHIAQVLTRLLEEAGDFHTLRIAVVDGGSTDGTQALVASLAAHHGELRLLHNPARIQSAAINLAVRGFGADADVLVRCDAHAGYPDGYCRRLVESLECHGADAVVVPLDSQGCGGLQSAVAWVSNSPIGTGGAAHRGGHRSGFVDHGHHAAFRMSSFLRVGGYDETFTHNEDSELDCRQRALGCRIDLDAGIRVAYHPRRTLWTLARQYFRYGAGRSRTVRRHPASLRARQLAVPVHVVATALACVLALAWPPALLYVALYLAVLTANALWLALRHRSPSGLWALPAAVVMHFAWGTGFLLALLAARERRWRPETALHAAAEPHTTGGL